jgi:deoxyribodipyrimidine photolyase-related protein
VTSTLKTSLWLVFPHQLFDQLPEGVETVAVMEDPLFFQQYAFHKQKLVFHRATMRCYADGLRQLLGWREFIRGLYLSVGRKQRTRNYWGYTRKIPQSFYDGTTGIVPVDVVIKKVLKNGYCHHIERLMVLSNFMLLCDFDPEEVYRWFMELFMDAYDWVMVPNVYGMGQFADGGMMSTKPYISGSNYLMKMGDFEMGAWTEVWDGLYWRFIDKHRDFFLKNPRMGVMVKSYDKMDAGKRDRLSAVATNYLEGLNDE